VSTPGTFQHRFEPAPKGAGDGTLLLLHGTGGNENDLLPLGRAIAAHAALLSPRGQVLEQGMPRFFRRNADGAFDHDDLVARTHALAAFVEESATRYGFDRTRITAVGFSNGANIAASLMLLHPRLLAGAILLRPMVPFIADALPDLSGRRVLVAAGRKDPVVPARQSEILAGMLTEAGADVTLHWSPGEHGLEAGDVAAASAWWQAAPARP
jgi:predicted esterase